MLTIEDINLLRYSGFTEKEIEHLNEDLAERPQTIDLQSADWQAVLAKRREYVTRKTREVARRNKVSTHDALAAVQRYINDCYKKVSALSPWVFFRSEYEKSKGRRADYRKAVNARAKAQALTTQVYR